MEESLLNYQLSKTTNLYNKHSYSRGSVGANSGRLGPDTSQNRDYSYDDGFEGKIESKLIVDKYVTVSLLYYYYFMHTFAPVVTKDYGPNPNDVPGNNTIGILNQMLQFIFIKRLALVMSITYTMAQGMKIIILFFNTIRTEDKIFLLFYFEDAQRRGHYM